MLKWDQLASESIGNMRHMRGYMWIPRRIVVVDGSMQYFCHVVPLFHCHSQPLTLEVLWLGRCGSAGGLWHAWVDLNFTIPVSHVNSCECMGVWWRLNIPPMWPVGCIRKRWWDSWAVHEWYREGWALDVWKDRRKMGRKKPNICKYLMTCFPGTYVVPIKHWYI